MDLEAAKQTSREGLANSVAAYRQMLADLDDAERAWVDQAATAIRATLEANGVPVDVATAKACLLGVMLPGVNISMHHLDFCRDEVPCLETHLRLPELAAARFLLDQQEGS